MLDKNDIPELSRQELREFGLTIGIVVVVVFFQDGLMGFLKHRKPEWFGIKVDTKEVSA